MSSIALTSIPPRACSEANNRNIVKTDNPKFAVQLSVKLTELKIIINAGSFVNSSPTREL